MKRIVATEGAPASPLFSQGVVAGPLVFVSGMTGVDCATGQQAGDTIQEQTRQAIRNGVAVVEAAGGTADDIVQVTVLLARPEDFGGMNQAYAALFPVDPPARAVTRFGPELPGVLVSISMIASVG